MRIEDTVMDFLMREIDPAKKVAFPQQSTDHCGRIASTRRSAERISGLSFGRTAFARDPRKRRDRRQQFPVVADGQLERQGIQLSQKKKTQNSEKYHLGSLDSTLNRRGRGFTYSRGKVSSMKSAPARLMNPCSVGTS
jgi:hypothetical protein